MLTITDLFCGAGGSSTGALEVPGVSVRMAANHWDLAIETHAKNHPDTEHDSADISQVDPRRYPTTDILWASPECTNHSRAKGRKQQSLQPDLFGETLPSEAEERSRATMWDVVRFSEVHRYKAVIVENVVEAWHWPPFQAWLMAMDSYGYKHRIVFLNSMHAHQLGLPAPQSRDRMYVIFWRRGNRAPDFDKWQRPTAYCESCDKTVSAIKAWKRTDRRWGRYRQQYVYRCPSVDCRNSVVEPAWLPASHIIDWSLPGIRIGDRDKPLSDKTMRRIETGIKRFWEPIHIEAAGHTYDSADPKHPQFGQPTAYMRAWPVHEPLRTIHTIESKGLAYTPLMVPAGGTWNDDARPASQPFRTRTTRESEGLVFPPFITELRGGASTARSASQPLAAVTAGGNNHALTVGENLNVEDVHFRMLEPDEIKRAMAFPADYKLLGTRRQQVRMSGNAVTPPAARDLIAAVVESITGEQVAA